MRMRDIVPWKRAESAASTALFEPRVEPLFSTLHRSLSGEIGRLLDEFAARSGFALGDEVRGFIPRVNVTDSPTDYNVTIELPGMTEKELDISVSQDNLIIRGERKKEERKSEESVTYYESSYGAFERTIPLYGEVDEDRIDAKMSNGVLTIKLPKTESSAPRSRKVSIRHA